MKKMLNNFSNFLMGHIAPNRCIFCGEKVYGREVFCGKCEKNTQPYRRYININLRKRSRIIKVLSPHDYGGKYKEFLLKFKFRGKKSYAMAFAKAICDTIEFDADVITYVPMTKKKKQERGYNQAELIAREIAKIKNIPCQEVLIKIKENEIQHRLKMKDRKQNVKNVYALKTDIKGQKIIVVDDIITSGSTIYECAKVLLKGDAMQVVGVCCADASNSFRME